MQGINSHPLFPCFCVLKAKISAGRDDLFSWFRAGGETLGHWYKTFSTSETISCAIWGDLLDKYSLFVPGLQEGR